GSWLHWSLWPINFQSKYLAMKRHFREIDEQVKKVQDVPLDRILTAIFLPCFRRTPEEFCMAFWEEPVACWVARASAGSAS
ncbi:hypothetical protein ACQP3F_33270, partial [Escherichia coli]